MLTSSGAVPAGDRSSLGATSLVRVASVPASHVYVRHLADPDGADRVVRLPDLPPADGVLVPGGWWPPAMLDAAWIEANHGAFDVFHVHFGFDAKTPRELADVALALERHGIPLVLTLHDLRNPHHEDVGLHDAQLRVLVTHAAAIVTLTPGAAREIERRWGRVATVLPHPHVVGRELLGLERPLRETFVVGLHAKSLRANMDVVAVAGALAEAVRELPDARLRIDLHDEVLDPANHWHAPAVARELARVADDAPRAELVVHPYFSDAELWHYFRQLDVSVLPYRFGTHSGWLEACHDLGTTVIAPTCGFYAEQRSCLSYGHDSSALDAPSLIAAVRLAYEGRPHWQADAGERLRERRELARAHEALYRGLLA